MSNTLYRFNNTKNSEVSAKLLYVAKARYDDDWHSTMHMHPFTELFYVIQGSGLFKIKEKSFTVKNDDLVTVNANLLHTESSKDSNPLEYIVLGVDGMSLKSLEEDELRYENLYTIHNYNEYREDILFYLNNIFNEVKNKNKHYEAICQRFLEILILNLTRRTESNIILSSDTNMNKDCAYIKKYIDVHYSTDLNLDSLATATYMNKYYLVHSFKESFGISPIEYLIKKRISVAKILLETTKYYIGEIAELVGFNSQSYFSQLFKKRVGITPGKYRENNERS